ncbi:glycosyltransferase family 4 protein [Clostridium estertheticum]|uniref:Glycosyl transferase family 1 n=2 Tax=Clostridium estertheticum TaxID=238834 RepID=A0A1J0GN04_9CLOT|nr:glycosyltransferase family 4 protein [Clostridium estertheticum]APC42746.1 glycosyl transferase family 1 [Clostridium estertheticum subsp. estertheticum]MBU3076089.1 glycosyltransferase family 4 protein [Clostridium estertheticum]MBU3166187.1 glycosyltransferase family 4 protein [Clostridium estertheticum]MBZ9616512.1 glycosyltransferase family 4 protein [Clostridium estertheticum subsp. laramiense]
MKKNFTLYWPSFVNAELCKDLGVITMIFNKHLNYNSHILCRKNQENYDEVTREGITMHYTIDDDTINNVLENTDILLLIGFYDFNLLMIQRFKSINPKGKVYLKLDLNVHWLGRIVFGQDTLELLNQCSLISVECRNLKKTLHEKWPLKIEYIPNGYYNVGLNKNIEYKEKENTIITVGRLGIYEKATEILLQAFKIAAKELINWKLKLIGGIDPNFQIYVDNFMNINPELKDRIIFTGRINDRELIEEEYRKAKIFCLTSRCEGFPNVFSEAANKGCYIISSDIDPAWDITDDKKYGSIFPINDYVSLANELITVCSNEERLETVCKDIQIYTKENFEWTKLCNKINSFLNENDQILNE